MDHRVTQCPRCGTSFRVTEAHLAVAAGAVRCGSCLHIFNARDHWLDDTPPVAKPEPLLSKRDLDDIEIDDDALFDDDTPIFVEDDAPPAKTSSGAIFNPVDDDFEVIDDGGPETFSNTFLELNSWEEESGHSFRETPEDDDPKALEEEQEWARKLLEEDEADNQTIAAMDAPARASIFEEYGDILNDVPEVDEDADVEQTGITELSPEFLDVDSDHDRTRTAPTFDEAPQAIEEIALESMHADRPLPQQTARPLFNLDGIEQEPLRLHQFVNEPRWPKVLWGIGLAVMVLVGIGQYLYFNFTPLARGELRPWLSRGCEIFNCVLPPQSDVAQIRTNSLIVRSHPTQRGALAVDAIITNQADFPQTYPPLQLQFTDLNGAPVAARQFSPAEYLSGELKGSRLMPARQPVHIALELLDPGPRAVNYLLTVVPAGPQ